MSQRCHKRTHSITSCGRANSIVRPGGRAPILAVLMVDDQLKLSRFNGDARNQTVQLPARRSANIKQSALLNAATRTRKLHR
jgi:hypothetical protein